MLVRDYMNSAPITIDSGADYKEAFTIMQQKNLRHLPVVDSSKKVVGILAQRDLQVAAQHFHEAPVEVVDVMHTPVTTISPTAEISAALDRLIDQGIGCLPVFEDDDNQLVGIITENDMLRAFRELLEKQG